MQPSLIWKHVENVNGKNLLTCVHCKKEFKKCGNTTNMMKHLRTQHPLFFDNQESLTSKETTAYTDEQKLLKRRIENTAPPDQENCPRKENPPKKQCVVS